MCMDDFILFLVSNNCYVHLSCLSDLLCALEVLCCIWTKLCVGVVSCQVLGDNSYYWPSCSLFLLTSTSGEYGFAICICCVCLCKVMGDVYYVFHTDHITFAPSHKTYELVNNRCMS
jgi:hypothetical protein